MREHYKEIQQHFDAIAHSRFSYDSGIAAVKNIVPPPASVLEMGCATGTMSIALAREGYTVTGIDCAQGLLDLASSKAAAESNPPRFLRGDIRTFSLDEKCDAGLLYESVIVLVQSQMDSKEYTIETYLDTVPDVIQGFTRMREHLKEKGIIAMSVKQERMYSTVHSIGHDLTYRVEITEMVSAGLKRLKLHHYVERKGNVIASSSVQKTLFPFEQMTEFAAAAGLKEDGFDSSGLFYLLKRA